VPHSGHRSGDAASSYPQCRHRGDSTGSRGCAVCRDRWTYLSIMRATANRKRPNSQISGRLKIARAATVPRKINRSVQL
jgi:hypothetical protein